MNIIETQGEGFSSVDLVHQCLIDPDKAVAFEMVLKQSIKSDSSVLELGTGTGILSLLAARAGANKIVAVEFDPFIAEVARENIRNNGYENKIKVITGDARRVVFQKEEMYDVIVMEMLCTCLIEEMQVQTINNLCSQNMIIPETIMIPSAQENYIALAQTDFMKHGFEMKMIKYLWPHQGMDYKVEQLSNTELLQRVDFSKIINEHFSIHIEFTVETPGNLNSALLSSKILINHDGSITLGSTFSLNPMIAIPLPEKKVKKGDKVSIAIDYKFGGGFQNFNISYL